MSSTLLRYDVFVPELDALPQPAIANLNIASVAVSTFMLILAVWCKCRLCNAHTDGLRCRALIVLSLSNACYSISQISLVGRPMDASNSLSVRMAAFVSTFSLVLNGLLVACAIGLDAAVRYGLRSFGLARRLSDCYEVVCFLIALSVSQPMLYVFDVFQWTGSAVTVDTDKASFDAAVWMFESLWIVLSMAVMCASVAFALLKARKITRCSSGNRSNESVESVLGTAMSIRGRVCVAVCYVIALMALLVWKVAFRISGSQSAWLLRTSGICEPLQAIVLLLVFILDIFVNISQRPEWLRVAGGGSSAVSSASSATTAFGQENRSFTSWGKHENTRWQNKDGCGSPKSGMAPTDEDIKMWMNEIRQCYIRSDISYYENEDYSVSDISYDSIPESCSASVVMQPLSQ
ncbi:hypothetical protein GQ54DRAFT_316314 [Martensiomyces pterosporus]|nr:hypothetical protein GQ54DRAFT_316314 [Martensiomyces pterosporus]